MARAILRANALRDGENPPGVINSIYLDTKDLGFYFDALNGDDHKQKVRLRWYGKQRRHDPVTLYLEVKSKRGFVGEKTRRPFEVAGDELGQDRIVATIESLNLNAHLPALGFRGVAWLRPILQVTYQRHRFVDALTVTPISLDLVIRSRLMDQAIVASPGWLELRNADIEIKGNEPRIPACFRNLRTYMPVWTSFSKYARCLEQHFERPGSAGWLTAL